MRWHEFEAACPEIATLAKGRFEHDEVVMLGTLRRDGRPRLSPVEPDFAAGHLLLGMMWRSKKALDLLRDPRCVVHSVPSDRMNSGGDVKLSGRALGVEEPRLRQAYRDAIRARIDWAPEESAYHLFALDVETAAYVRFEEAVWEVRHWTPAGGLRKDVRAND